MKASFINIHTHTASHFANTLEVLNIIIDENNQTSNIYTCGIHPWYINEINPSKQLSTLKQLSDNINCIAIGECGLDKLKGAETSMQELYFTEQIKLAKQRCKPLIIHCVKRYPEVLKCLKNESFDGYFLIHGFNANLENVKPYLPLHNSLFSFGKHLLQQGSNAELLFRQLPVERCFFETDDHTDSIKNIYLRAAEIKGISLNELQKNIIDNYKRVFVYGLD